MWVSVVWKRNANSKKDHKMKHLCFPMSLRPKRSGNIRNEECFSSLFKSKTSHGASCLIQNERAALGIQSAFLPEDYPDRNSVSLFLSCSILNYFLKIEAKSTGTYPHLVFNRLLIGEYAAIMKRGVWSFSGTDVNSGWILWKEVDLFAR